MIAGGTVAPRVSAFWLLREVSSGLLPGNLSHIQMELLSTLLLSVFLTFRDLLSRTYPQHHQIPSNIHSI